MIRAFITLGIAIAATDSSASDVSPRRGTANQMAEWTFTSEKNSNDPFNEVELNVNFTAPDGSRLRVPAFWAGGRTWKVRYASAQLGRHRFETECSDGSDTGLHQRTGEIEMGPYTGENPFYLHGPIRVVRDHRHFEHTDGTPFLWLADTWWMGLTRRLHWPDEFKTLAADRVEKGFNVIQIVAGLYPDMPAFDERGANNAGFPWTRDYSRINPEYFDDADVRLAWLVDSGLSPCIVGAWGYHLPWLGVERMKKHWRYLIARYGAWPVFWCLAGEGTMPYYLSKNKKQDGAVQLEGWTDIGRYVRKTDPFHRLISIHPSESARSSVNDLSVLDFDMLQTGHGDRASMPGMIRIVRQSVAAKPPLPSVNSEVTYEGILDTCYEEIQRFTVWTSLLSGTAGHTYGANGIWQVNRSDEPYGKSPHGGNWGNTPWDEAMHLPGSRQVGLAKQLLEKYHWWEFEPHPEWVSRVDAPASGPQWGDWIWYPKGEPAKDAPVGRCYFRKSVEIKDTGRISADLTAATLHIAGDDRFTVFVNGKRVGGGQGWQYERAIDLRPWLIAGRNVLCVEGENAPAPVPQNPAGLLCSLELTQAGATTNIRSDSTWKCTLEEQVDWRETRFDDQQWPNAVVIAKYGDGPWGKVKTDDALNVTSAAGIPQQVRVVYVPAASTVAVHKIEHGIEYAAKYVDPATGRESAVGPVTADEHQTWTAPPPPIRTHDWILVLEP